MSTIGVVTYHYPHLKTEQVMLNLLSKYDASRFSIYALPFTPRKERTIQINHRPDMSRSVPPELLAKKHGIPYTPVASDAEIPNGHDMYLILGAGILSKEFVTGKKTINCHPGVIPAVRGLDAFKWSIYEMKPLGVSLHYIDEEVDAGEVISIIPTDVYKTDTFETICRRHYETELNLVCDFERYMREPVNPFKGIAVGEPHRRMGQETEAEMIRRFEEYKERFGQ